MHCNALLVQSRREFQDLRRPLEFNRGGTQRARLLETIIGQHALVMIDLVRWRNQPQTHAGLMSKLKTVQEDWTNVLLYQSGQDTKNTRTREEEREFRFQRTVYAMVDAFVKFLWDTIANKTDGDDKDLKLDWIDMYSMISPKAARFYKETTQKFQTYKSYLCELSYFAPDELETSAFYIAASAAIVTGTNLGAWLDVVL